MINSELQDALSEIQKIEIRETGTGLAVFIPAIAKDILLVSKQIVDHQFFVDPFGNQALRLMRRGDGLHLLIISQHDFVFEPMTSDADPGLPEMVSFKVTDMPPLIGYSEIAVNLDQFSRVCDKMTRIDHILGQMILFRYGINGAQRIGIDCSLLEHKWQALHSRLHLDRIQEPFLGESCGK